VRQIIRYSASGPWCRIGAIFGGLVAPVLTYIAVNYNVGFGVAMMVGTLAGQVDALPRRVRAIYPSRARPASASDLHRFAC
jgi:hypothetical protein